MHLQTVFRQFPSLPVSLTDEMLPPARPPDKNFLSFIILNILNFLIFFVFYADCRNSHLAGGRKHFRTTKNWQSGHPRRRHRPHNHGTNLMPQVAASPMFHPDSWLSGLAPGNHIVFPESHL